MGRKEQVLKYLRELHGEASLSLDNGNWGLINLCAHQDWEDAVRLLRSKFGAQYKLSDHQGRSILHWAVENEWHLGEEYEHLSRHDVDLQDRDSKTALHVAAEIGNVEAARWLLQRGASFKLRDKRGRTAVHVAAWVFCRKIMNLFLDTGVREFGRDFAGRGLLHYLAMWADEDYLCQVVRRKRMLLDIHDRQRRTSLHYAALTSNYDAAAALLSLGCSVNRRDSNGWTALHYALRNASYDFASLLADYQADFSTPNGFGQSCFQLSIRSGNFEIPPLVRTHSLVDPAHIDRFNRTPFHDLCEVLARSRKRMIAKADVFSFTLGPVRDLSALADILDYRGYSPMHIAVFTGNPNLARALVDVNRRCHSYQDENGCTPLDWAEASCEYLVADVLKHYGAGCEAGHLGWAVMRSYWPDRLRARDSFLKHAGEPDKWALVRDDHAAISSLSNLADQRPRGQQSLEDVYDTELLQFEVSVIERDIDILRRSNYNSLSIEYNTDHLRREIKLRDERIAYVATLSESDKARAKQDREEEVTEWRRTRKDRMAEYMVDHVFEDRRNAASRSPNSR